MNENCPISNSRKIVSSGIVVFCLMTLASPLAVARSAHAVALADAMARIDNIVISGAERSEVGETEARITRASNGKIEPAKIGMLLYANDRIATGDNAKLIIRSLNLSSDNDPRVIVYPNSQIQIVDNRSFSVMLGKAWFNLKGVFRVTTFYWILGARGTEFEVSVTENNSTMLAVLEGVVDATATNVKVTGARRRATPKTLEIKELEEASLGNPASAPKRLRLTAERVQSILSPANEVILASQPAHPARRVFPHFSSPVERSLAFTKARFEAIWRKDPAAFVRLGEVHSDWGEGAKALQAYKKAVSLHPAFENSVSVLTDMGESYRLIGEIDNVEPYLVKALNLAPDWAPTLNAAGNLYLNRAIDAYRDEDWATAKKNLENAASAYERSFNAISKLSRVRSNISLSQEISSLGGTPELFPGRTTVDLNALAFASKNSTMRFDPEPWLSLFANTRAESFRLMSGGDPRLASNSPNQYRGVAKVNIGDVKTLLGTISQLERDPEKAARFYKEAQEAYLEARKFYPDYPYIGRLLDQVQQAAPPLPPQAPPVQPTPKTEAPRAKRAKRLEVSIRTAPAGDNAIATATSIAAVVSYLEEAEVEPCEILSLMHQTGCCDSPRGYCLDNSDERVRIVVRSLWRYYDVRAEIFDDLSFNAIATQIDRNRPIVVLLDNFPTLVISGYREPDQIIVLIPSLEGERIMSHRDLIARRWIGSILFQSTKSTSAIGGLSTRDKPAQQALKESAIEISKMFLDGKFGELADRFKVLPGVLEGEWKNRIALSGAFTKLGAPSIRPIEGGYDASVRFYFEREIVSLRIVFDAKSKPIRFFISPP